MQQQPRKQRDIRTGPQRQVQVSDFAGRRAARIDDDDFGPVRLLGCNKSLIQHRVAPGHVAADEDDKIGRLDIVVAAGDDILAEGADMPGYARGHAQTRIGVDVRAADEALHQLVGDVIVLGQQLAGDIKRDRIRTVGGDRPGESFGDQVERLVPACG